MTADLNGGTYTKPPVAATAPVAAAAAPKKPDAPATPEKAAAAAPPGYGLPAQGGAPRAAPVLEKDGKVTVNGLVRVGTFDSSDEDSDDDPIGFKANVTVPQAPSAGVSATPANGSVASQPPAAAAQSVDLLDF